VFADELLDRVPGQRSPGSGGKQWVGPGAGVFGEPDPQCGDGLSGQRGGPVLAALAVAADVRSCTVRAPYRRLSPAAVRAIMGHACRRAGLDRVGAHRLRHSLATEMLRAGASLPEVGQVLRHRSQLATSVYAKVDDTALRVLARVWPGGER
jgi:integrase